ncbi:MAG: hypothetical protein QM811_19690 [Pirellulales bacterium]
MSQSEILRILSRLNRPITPIPWYGLPDEIEEDLNKKSQANRS